LQRPHTIQLHYYGIRRHGLAARSTRSLVTLLGRMSTSDASSDRTHVRHAGHPLGPSVTRSYHPATDMDTPLRSNHSRNGWNGCHARGPCEKVQGLGCFGQNIAHVHHVRQHWGSSTRPPATGFARTWKEGASGKESPRPYDVRRVVAVAGWQEGESACSPTTYLTRRCCGVSS
jgi:hypothetical protein